MNYAIDKFPIENTVLYCKGWSPKSNDMFKDLKVALRKDGYETITNYDIYYILMNEFNNWNNWLIFNHLPFYSIKQYTDTIFEMQCINRLRKNEFDDIQTAIQALCHIFKFSNPKYICFECNKQLASHVLK